MARFRVVVIVTLTAGTIVHFEQCMLTLDWKTIGWQVLGAFKNFGTFIERPQQHVGRAHTLHQVSADFAGYFSKWLQFTVRVRQTIFVVHVEIFGYGVIIALWVDSVMVGDWEQVDEELLNDWLEFIVKRWFLSGNVTERNINEETVKYLFLIKL